MSTLRTVSWRYAGAAAALMLPALALPAAVVGQQDTTWVGRGLSELYAPGAERANFQSAARIFESASIALAGQPGEARALELLAEAQFWGRLDGLEATLWRLFDSGRPADVSEFALRALTDTAAAFAGDRPEFLVLFAAGLSRQFYDPAEFLTSPTAEALREPSLLADTSVGLGIQQLLAWHGEGALSTPQGPNVWEVPDLLLTPTCHGEEWAQRLADDPRRWSWWHQGTGGTPDTAQTASPESQEPSVPTRSEVGRSLLRTLGAWYGQRGEFGDRARATAYLCIASVLDPGFILTFAFRDLLWNYLDADRVDLLKDLHRRDRYRSHMHGEDREYIRQIEDALSFHRRWPWLVVGGGGVVAFACLVEFVICESDPPITVLVTVP